MPLDHYIIVIRMAHCLFTM
ncbi:hypothetical protein BLA29_015025 [Euroglyphus maynei]|uniref:Uncharacterized protein n=1 Tax=Euroglyphus maynei TaxID=6958 RepID=A0A1Y3ASX8_EURMA|nr:hypothetical protein BLA29_015025 [Euroglyphus maynei]